MSAFSVGIDVGGTFAKVGLVDAAGNVVRSEQIPTNPRRAPNDFVEHVCAALSGWKFSSVGLGLAGGVDAETGRLLFAPNLRQWIGFSFKRAFEKRLKVRTVADNDANVAVWGGYVVGLRKKPRHVIGVTLGTGVGGGLILDGRLHRGGSGAAGELGHQVIVRGGVPCHCGRRGCLEAYAGTYGILRAARRHMRRIPTPFSPKSLAEAARVGVPGARKTWDEVGGHLGTGLANAVLMFNPEAVLILGGVARAGHLILGPVKRCFAAQPFRDSFKNVQVTALSERDWGCVGAALLSRERN